MKGSIANFIFTKEGLLAAAVVAGAFYLTRNVLLGKENQVKANIAYAYDTAVTATTDTNVDELKNQVLKYIYAGAMNPALVIDNLEAIKSEVNNYTTKLTALAAEKTAGRITSSTINYYLKTVAEEIAKKLNIEIRPSGGYGGGYYDDYDRRPRGGGYYGGYFPGGGGMGGFDTVDYQDMYQKYVQYLQQMQQLYQGQYGYPSYGYSYGYGYQQPNIQPQYPTQNYNYYPQQQPYGGYVQQYDPYSQMGGSIYNQYGTPTSVYGQYPY